MATFSHPLQLFKLDYPDAWEARYREDTGSVMFVDPSPDAVSAVSVTPVAVTGASTALEEEIFEAAARLRLQLDPGTTGRRQEGDTQVAWAEGSSTAGEESLLSGRCRFWLVRHGPVNLYIVQLGPGASSGEQRSRADALIASLEFPEIFPPTPHEFQERVMEIIRREYPDVVPTPSGEWAVELDSPSGERIATMGLENLYRACLLSAETAGALIRDHLDQVLDNRPEPESFLDLEGVRDRLLPQLKSEDWVREISGGGDLVRVEFAPGLVLCFVVDEPTRIAYVTTEMLEAWGLPLERVQGIAVDNLARKMGEVRVTALNGQGDRPVALILNEQDGYDATRICLPSLAESFAEELGETFLVGLPNRDFLVAFSERDEEVAAGIIRQIKQDFHAMSHPITDTIYRMRPDGLQPTEL